MAINNYKCTECDFKEEYIEGSSTSKESHHPEICPKCNKGKLERYTDWSNWGTHTQPPAVGTYQHQRRINQINQAIMNPRSNHNTNPY